MNEIERDSNGFLSNFEAWDEGIAKELATEEHIELQQAHWELLYLLRDYYREFDSSPAMRALTKYISIKLDKHKASSIYLLSLFPGSPAKKMAKIAGLPKPANCL